MKSIELLKPYFKECRFSILLGLACLIAVDMLQLFIPRIIKWVVDDLTALQIDSRRLLVFTLYIVAIAVMIGCLRYVWRRCLLGTSRRVEEGLRNTLFAHVQMLSAAYFNRVKTGDLMAHATNDLQQIRMATGMGMVALNDAIVLGTAAVGFMIYINLKLTLIVLIPAPLIVFGTRFFTKKMHHRYQAVQGAFSDLTETVRERFAGIRITKAYNREEMEALRFRAVSKQFVDQNLSLVKITGAFFPMMTFFTNVSLAIVLFLGGHQTITAIITPGDFVAFISYLGLLTWPMMAMGWVMNLIQRGAASLDRINTILETGPEISDRPGLQAVPHTRGEIAFDGVAFRYHPQADPVLADINFNLAPGNSLGIIGPPGSGKTSLLNLIPRLFDVSRGSIRLDGVDIRQVPLGDLRSHIAFMPQEPFLFNGSIRENITLGATGLSEADLIRATQQAALYDNILSFPKGFDTLVGEKGVILSGGQKQRIALARCLIKNAAILILDDPVSQVDVATGSAIIDTIQSLAGQKTIIIVSHRLAAVRYADQVMALEHGRIAESGIHAQLMAQDRYYARTFRLQEIEEAFNEA